MRRIILIILLICFLPLLVQALILKDGETMYDALLHPGISKKKAKIFEFEVKTVGADTFTLPLESSGTYAFRINWGDGNSDTITGLSGATNHSYAAAGTYNVKIKGTIKGWRFNNVGDKTLIYDIKSWGPLNLGNSNGYFFGCSNLTVSATDELDLDGTTTLRGIFSACSSLTSLDVSNWNIGKITIFQDAFYNCSSLASLDVSNWDTSSVTDFVYTFFGCSSLTSLDVSSWNTSLVTTFHYTFFGCSSLTALDVSNWDTSLVTTFDNTFISCLSLMSLDVSSWNTESVTNFNKTFKSCSSLNFYGASGVSNWDVTALTTATDFMSGASDFSVADYDDVLISWENQAVKDNVPVHFGTSKCTSGVSTGARQRLIDDHNWTITDGGAV